jgi:biotin carboxyl carrier protein
MFEKIKNIRRVNVRDSYRSVTASSRYKDTVTYLRKSPFRSFFIALGILLLIMISGSVISNLNKKESTPETMVKNVTTYKIGEAPTVRLQAQIEKKGVIEIVAQTAGVVGTIHVEEGAELRQGQYIASLTSNYQGGSAPALQAQLAAAQAKNVRDTYDTQKDLLEKQRLIAEKSEANADELSTIARASATDTRNLLTLNESILNTVDDALEQAEVSGNQEAITAAQQAKAQVEAGVTQLRGTLRNLEYQGNQDKPAAELATLQKDIALKQLDVQAKALDLSRDVAGIQYNLALVSEGLMHPSAPYPAVVERILVERGETVTPGTPIAIVRCLDVATSAVLRVPRDIALSISRTEPSIFHIGDKKVNAVPSYVSTVATDGQLHSIVFTLPESAMETTTDLEYVGVDVPVTSADTTSAVPFVPIDSIYQSQDQTTVNVVEDNQVVARTITLGPVYGSYVEVQTGLNRGDQVILNRNVIVGDKVTTSSGITQAEY